MLCHLRYSSFHRRRDSNPQPLDEVARAFTTLQTLAAGISEQSLFQCAPGASANLSAAGLEPVTSQPLAFEGTLFFTTPQTLQSFSLPPYFASSLLLFRHTSSVRATTQLLLAESTRHKFPGGISVHRIGNQALLAAGGLVQRSNRELHHPRDFLPPGNLSVKSDYAVPVAQNF